jgi:hypothetical protein
MKMKGEVGRVNGWAESSLEKLASIIKDGPHGTHTDVDDGVPFLSAKDVRDGKLRSSLRRLFTSVRLRILLP